MSEVIERTTSASERNFATFELGDNVYELAGGLIPQIAERLDVKLGAEPNSEDLQAIMDKVGSNKVLRHNAEITAIDRATQVEIVNTAGTQTAMDRSLLTPAIKVTHGAVDAVVVVSCVANWQDRAAEIVSPELSLSPAYLLGGERVMDTATETPNPNVQRMRGRFGRYPKEAEYAGSVILPKLAARGYHVLPVFLPTKSGDVLFAKLFEQNPVLLKKRIAIVRNANAGVISAIQMRDAARKHNPAFDTYTNWPQVLIKTDALPVATTDEEEMDSWHFQKSDAAMRQLVLAAKKQHEAAGGE